MSKQPIAHPPGLAEAIKEKIEEFVKSKLSEREEGTINKVELKEFYSGLLQELQSQGVITKNALDEFKKPEVKKIVKVETKKGFFGTKTTETETREEIPNSSKFDKMLDEAFKTFPILEKAPESKDIKVEFSRTAQLIFAVYKLCADICGFFNAELGKSMMDTLNNGKEKLITDTQTKHHATLKEKVREKNISSVANHLATNVANNLTTEPESAVDRLKAQRAAPQENSR